MSVVLYITPLIACIFIYCVFHHCDVATIFMRVVMLIGQQVCNYVHVFSVNKSSLLITVFEKLCHAMSVTWSIELFPVCLISRSPGHAAIINNIWHVRAFVSLSCVHTHTHTVGHTYRHTCRQNTLLGWMMSLLGPDNIIERAILHAGYSIRRPT